MQATKSLDFRKKLLFLYKFFCYPGQIGSITPSSKRLGRKMASSLPWEDVEFAAELGAGTGAITRHLLDSKGEKTKLILFEKDGTLRDRLTAEFPGYPVYPDACRLREALGSEGVESLDAVVSGLPFANFPQALRDQLMDEIVSSLKPGGLFIAFQYSLQMKKQLKNRFALEAIKFVPINLPPAFVYVCRKPVEE